MAVSRWPAGCTRGLQAKCGVRPSWTTTYRRPPLRVRPAASGGRGRGTGGAGAGAPGDDTQTRAALAEAVELVKRAQRMAQQQTRAELMQAQIAASGGRRDGAAAAEEEDEEEPCSEAAVAAYLREQGVGDKAAAAVAAQLATAPDGGSGGDSGADADEGRQSSGGGGGTATSSSSSSSSSGSSREGPPRRRPGPSRAALEAQWLLLMRVLPGADLAAMVSREPALLHAGGGVLVARLVALAEAFPGADVISMVERRPGLLLLEDLPARCERAVGKLLQLHPSHDRRIVAGLIFENPELLVRMDYYAAAVSLDDLPIEIQNMMVPGGQAGIGWLYRYWAEKRRAAAAAAGGGGGGGEGGPGS